MKVRSRVVRQSPSIVHHVNAIEQQRQLWTDVLEKRAARFGLSSRQRLEAKSRFPHDPEFFRRDITTLGALVLHLLGPDLRGKKILEVGCNDFVHGMDGDTTGMPPSFLLRLADQGVRASGLDIAKPHIPPKYRQKIAFQLGRVQDLGRFFPRQQFDCIVAQRVFQPDLSFQNESIFGSPTDWNRRPTKAAMLSQMFDKLKPGGFFANEGTGDYLLFSKQDFGRAGFRRYAMTSVPVVGHPQPPLVKVLNPASAGEMFRWLEKSLGHPVKRPSRENDTFIHGFNTGFDVYIRRYRNGYFEFYFSEPSQNRTSVGWIQVAQKPVRTRQEK